MKEELMLLGFISLFLTVFQGPISHICIPKHTTNYLLPCKENAKEHFNTNRVVLETEFYTRKLFSTYINPGRLLSNVLTTGFCENKGMAPLLSLEGVHQLDIFVFILAIMHVIFCILTMLLGSAKVYTWKQWEPAIKKNPYKAEETPGRKYTPAKLHSFLNKYSPNPLKTSAIKSWMVSFFRQFYGSVSRSEYHTFRLAFIQTHFGDFKDYNFYEYLVRTLEDEFKKIVGIRWYLWLFVVVFLLLNIHGWHIYLWMAFIPLFLLLALGAKLEHIKIQLAQEVAEKHTAVEGVEVIIKPSNHHFWFSRPELVLHLIQFILFQNAFEIAFFFWILSTYGFSSCIMGNVEYVIPRLVIGAMIQILCSYSTLPLYALISQMGDSPKKTIISQHAHERIIKWLERSRENIEKGKAEREEDKPMDSSGKDIEMQKSNDDSQMQS